MEDIWQTTDIGEDVLTGYEDIDEDVDYGDDDADDDLDLDLQDDEPDYQFSYAQIGQIGGGDVGIGSTVGGKYSKMEKMIEAQTVSKDKLYIRKLKADLKDYFSDTKINHYAQVTQLLPRYWLKNGPALAATFYMIDSLVGKLKPARLSSYSSKTGIPKEDLFRYYRLITRYWTPQ